MSDRIVERQVGQRRSERDEGRLSIDEWLTAFRLVESREAVKVVLTPA